MLESWEILERVEEELDGRTFYTSIFDGAEDREVVVVKTIMSILEYVLEEGGQNERDDS